MKGTYTSSRGQTASLEGWDEDLPRARPEDGDVLEGQVTAKYTVNYTVHTELQCTEYLAADQLQWIDWLLQASVNRLQCQSPPVSVALQVSSS